MSFRLYLIFMGLATALSWGGWLFILWTTDPYSSGIGALVLFYLTLLLSSIGTLTLAGLVYRIVIRKREYVLGRQVRIAFRHAVTLSIVAIIALFFSSQSQLTWWVLLLLLATASVAEYYFLMQEESRRT